MPSKIVHPEPLDPNAFAPFGDVLIRPDHPPTRDLRDYRYWDKIATLSFSNDPVDLAYLTLHHRPLRLTQMERHRKASQTFIPLSQTPCIFALAPAHESKQTGPPDIEVIRAFIIEGQNGVNLHPGTWHWSMFPLEETADFIMVVRRDTIVDDQEIVELEGEVELKV